MNEEENSKIYKAENKENASITPGNLQRLPDESLPEKTLVFIDEGFLNELSKYFGNGKYLKFDKIIFSKNLCAKQSLICEKIFYYTAPPFQNPVPSYEDEKKKEGYDKFVNKLRERGVIVREGRCQRLKIDGNFEYRQKGVDALAIIDLMSIPLEYKHIKKIVLIANDSDFVPVIEHLRKLDIRTILHTYYEQGRKAKFSTSNELIKSVHKYVLLSKDDFDKSFLIRLDKGEIK